MLSNAAPVLKKHGFKIIQSVHPQTKQKTNGGCIVYSSAIQKFYNGANCDDGGEGAREKINIKKSHFQCDVFFSYFDSGGFLRNNASWGLYHGKNIHMKDVLPFQRRAFDGLHLPFFKNVASEVYKCYGNVEQCIVESHNLNVRAIYQSWTVAHAEFERIKQCAKENTMKVIFQGEGEGECEGEDECEGGRDSISILDNTFFKNSLHVLRDMHINKTKTVYSFSIDFIIQHAACIKYYFPTVNIEYFSYSRDNQVIMFLNYVDVIHVYNAAVYDFYNDPRIMYLKKPRIDMITVVTFGRFSCDSGDSKEFSILTECAKYSENICVGLLCDAPESFESRAHHIKQCCKFVKKVWKDDGSAEFKNRCIKMSQANILVTGEEDVGPENNVNHCSSSISSSISIVRVRSRKNITSDNKTKSVRFL
jgi:hypothetical protein